MAFSDVRVSKWDLARAATPRTTAAGSAWIEAKRVSWRLSDPATWTRSLGSECTGSSSGDDVWWICAASSKGLPAGFKYDAVC